MCKKFLSLLLALVLVLGYLPMAASAVEGEDWLTVSGIKGGRIQFDKGKGTITRCEKTVTSANIPSTIDGVAVVGIGEAAFVNCTQLSSVIIPEGVLSLGDYSFGFDHSLKSVTIPSSVREIANSSFSACGEIETIEVAQNNRYYCSVGGVLFNKNKTELIAYAPGKKDLEYTIPDGVTKIGVHAFLSSRYLNTITIPNTVNSFGVLSFSNTPELIAINVAEDNMTFCSVDGVLFNKGKTRILVYPSGKSEATYTIPQGITEIGWGAFEDGVNLKEVIIPDSVTIIDQVAFHGCSTLESVDLPDSITEIRNVAFGSCRSLTEVSIPASVRKISDQAFSSCSNLETVTMLGDAPEFGNFVFSNCAENFCIYYYAKNHGWSTPTWEGYPSSPIGTKPATPDRPSSPPSVPSDDDSIVETDTTENGNTATTTTQPNGDRELKIETPTGETIADIDLPADPGAGKKFDDVSTDSWYVGVVDKATAYGLFSGTSDTTFSPDNNMTRSMLAQILYNLSGKVSYGVGESVFIDVARDAWYANAVNWAAKAEVVSGTGNGQFSPDASVTREQLVTMLYNYAKVIGADTTPAAGLDSFPDGDSVSNYAQTPMKWAIAMGFLSGRAQNGGKYIAPQGTATRAEVAVILSKFVESLK